MGSSWDHLSDELAAFCNRQKVFFVGTAPRDGGHVNVSPKGYDSFRVIDSHTVAYADLTGSGIETIAHLRDNGRITLMFTAFDGPANIVRIYGNGTAVSPEMADYGDLASRFGSFRSVRAIIRVDIDLVSSSCGYAVPLMDFVGDRTRLEEWISNKSDAELSAYQAKNNASSIDGLPGLQR